MKRHAALIPLTHDHHHALAHARRLRVASESADPEARLKQAGEFLEFFRADTLLHFREEEETLFPKMVDLPDAPLDMLGQVLLEHVRIHAAVERLAREADAEDVSEQSLARISSLLDAHIRLEERKLFPLIERSLSEETLADIHLAARRRGKSSAEDRL